MENQSPQCGAGTLGSVCLRGFQATEALKGAKSELPLRIQRLEMTLSGLFVSLAHAITAAGKTYEGQFSFQ